jgi:hypothetical protein
MKKFFLFYFLIVTIFLFSSSLALADNNSGFIPGQIWYSKETLVEGDSVNIHTAVWNGEKDTISARVEFYDKNVILGSRDVTLSASELKDVSVMWKVTSGDHVISAKIISSTISNKKEKVILSRNETSDDKKYVEIVVKNNTGKVISDTNVLKDQVDKASSELNNIIPEQVSTSVSGGLNTLDNFREDTYKKVSDSKEETQKKLDSFKSNEKIATEVVGGKTNIEDATEKPITYIRLFLLSFLSFVLGNQIVFYAILVLVIFYLIRFVYRKIRR